MYNDLTLPLLSQWYFDYEGTRQEGVEAGNYYKHYTVYCSFTNILNVSFTYFAKYCNLKCIPYT